MKKLRGASSSGDDKSASRVATDVTQLAVLAERCSQARWASGTSGMPAAGTNRGSASKPASGEIGKEVERYVSVATAGRSISSSGKTGAISVRGAARAEAAHQSGECTPCR